LLEFNSTQTVQPVQTSNQLLFALLGRGNGCINNVPEGILSTPFFRRGVKAGRYALNRRELLEGLGNGSIMVNFPVSLCSCFYGVLHDGLFTIPLW
jgi:hypothetical protein